MIVQVKSQSGEGEWKGMERKGRERRMSGGFPN